MKSGSANATQVSANQTGGLVTDSFNSGSAGAKYNGMIDESFFKVLKRDLTQLFSYVYSVAPLFFGVHRFVTIVRILQFIGPALCAPYERFWKEGTDGHTTVSVLSIFFHLIPTQYREDAGLYVSIIYSVIVFGILALCVAAAKSFKKNAKLPTAVSSFISFYFALFGQILHPIALQVNMESMSRYIWDDRYPFKLANTIMFGVVVVVSAIYVYLFLAVASQSLIFRPMSLMTTNNLPQNLMFAATPLVTVFLGLACHGTEMIQLIFSILGALTYFVTGATVFLQGGYITHSVANMVLTSSITGALMVIIVTVCTTIKMQGTLLFFFLFIVLWIVVFLINHFVLQKWSTKHLLVLDAILENPENFAMVRNANHFLNVGVTGFAIGHPVCINWSYFKQGVEIWPKKATIWYMFAKFVSIYPEETQMLAWIFHTVSALKLRGGEIRCIKEQSVAITRQREANLSPALKAKLNSLSKHLQKTKHKLRHVWDVVIQGNIREVEGATKRAAESIEQNDADFKHLFRTFPNNRFVTRAYSRFLIEIQADHVGSNQMIEKTRLLQRGIMVNTDQPHELGLETFPALPERVQQANVYNSTNVAESMQSMSTDIETNDEDIGVDFDQVAALKTRIEKISIPAIKNSKIMRAALFILLFLAPLVAMLIYINIYVENLQEPLEYIYHLSYIRAQAFQLAAFSHRLVLEKLKLDGTPILATLPQHVSPPVSLGSSWDTREQLVHIMKSATDSNQKIVGLRSFERDNPTIQKVQSLVFDASLDYVNYLLDGNSEEQRISLQAAMSDFIVQLEKFTNPGIEIVQDMTQQPIILNLAINTLPATNLINDALDLMNTFIIDRDEKAINLANILMYSVICVVVVVYIVSMVLQLRWINTNKEETYRCLTALPKNTVSSLAENLRILKKDNGTENSSTMGNSEMNKQEDNIMKIFNNGGTHTSKHADVILLIITTVLSIGLHIGMTYLLVELFKHESTTLKQNAPHLNNLLGAYAMEMGAYYSVQHMLVRNLDGVYTKVRSVAEHYVNAMNRLEKGRYYFHQSRFGGEELEDTPFLAFDRIMSQASSNCPNPYDLFDSFETARQCFPVDMSFVLLEPMIKARLQPWVDDPDQEGALDHKDQAWISVWNMMIWPLLEELFTPMYESIIPTINEEMTSEMNRIYPIAIALCVIALIGEILAFIQLRSIEAHIRSVLALLLHVQPDVVTSTPKIMKILSGNFSTAKSDAANRDAEFFDTVFMSLPDAVMYADAQSFVIQGANESCKNLFGDTEFIGHNIRDFYNTTKFDGEVEKLLTSSTTVKLSCHTTDGTEVHYDVTSVTTNNRLVVSAQDITQTVRYNTLIAEERAKSDHLLATILPPSLVKRVQAGEKNISFAVQSASISFIDIVEFTPWCGSLPATTVMSTLNQLFKMFDGCVATYPTMTKVKCIGDCYMSAGGIFSEINQPATHAKEVVSFGLDAISSIEEINKQLNQSLRIRVGVNTGGPIVAGVLGIGKPTFEILGPAINLAQQMEHHGVPMQVHVSRAVYELIYGDSFNIKERGSVEVKGGNIITYLVSSRK